MQRAVRAIVARVERSLIAHGMIVRGQRVLVAVSGGPDSVGLLGILAQLRRKLGFTLVAGHVNHHLRGAESDADEHCAAEAAAKVGVSFVRCDLPSDLAATGNLEERARELRYRALRRLAAENDCQRVATGHTRDDQAETLMLRLLRGTATAGLAGIRRVRADGVIRPLLDCERSEVALVARQLALTCRIDASNADTRFTRNRLRHELFPLLRRLSPNVSESLARTATLFEAEAAIISEWVDAQLDELVRDHDLDLAGLKTVPLGLQGHVVRAWLLREGVPARTVGARHVELVLALAASGSASGSIALRRPYVVRRTYGYLTLTNTTELPALEGRMLRPGETLDLPGGWRIAALPRAPRPEGQPSGGKWVAVCDADRLEQPFGIRPARSGERVSPLGLSGTKKVSDVFIDAKVPARERKTYPVVTYDDTVVWIPGLVRGRVLLLGPSTRRVVELQASRDAILK